MARKKLRESESLHSGFTEDFAAETERDTWEKGQQAGRWLSQHLYSEREKREMEQRRRGARAGERKAEAGRPGAKEAEAAQTEAGRGGAAQSTALAAQSAPEGAKKRTPATGVSAQQNAAWQAAGQSRAGQAPVFSLTASSRAHAPQRENDAQPSLPAPGLQPWDFEQELQRTQASIQALIQGAREEGQARQEQREQQQAAQQTNKAPLSPSDSLKQQMEELISQRTSMAYSGPDMRTNAEKRGGLLRTEAAALEDVNAKIEQTQQEYGQAFETELAQAEHTIGTRDIGTMKQWLSADYYMSGPQCKGVENAWAEYQNTELGRIAQKDSLAAAELMTPEEYEYYTVLAALHTKANAVIAGMAGFVHPVISAIPFYENALEAWEEWIPQQLGFEPIPGTGMQETFQNVQVQHPAAYSVGRVAGEAATNYALQGFLQGAPVWEWFDSVGQKASQTAPMQALQQLPVAGHLGTPQAVTGILEGTAYDTLTQTGPYVWDQIGAYNRQQAEGLAPGEQPVTPSGIALGAAQNAGQNLAFNILGEWGLGIMDGGRHGPVQDAMDAAQRRAFVKSASGEAMTPQEKQLMDDLWNTDPAKASEYWAAGEFLDTGAPTSSALDGGGFDGTMKAKAEASPTGQRTPFDYLQDGKGWEAPSETVTRANIAAFENGEKTFNDVVDDYAILYAEKVNSNRTWRWDEISNAYLTQRQKKSVKQRAIELGKIPKVLKKPGMNYLDFERSGLIYEMDGSPVIFSLPQKYWRWSDRRQFALLDSWLPGGKRPEGYIWHHSEQTGRMELVPFGIHNITSHIGGRASGMWAAGKR